jgi:hypothetical protein
MSAPASPSKPRSLRLHPLVHAAAVARAAHLHLSVTSYVVQLIRADLFGDIRVQALAPLVDMKVSRPGGGFTMDDKLWSMVSRRARLLDGSPASYVETLILQELAAPVTTFTVYPDPGAAKPPVPCTRRS